MAFADSYEVPGRKRLYLVACVSKKRAEPCQAKYLYDSPWFHKARAYVEQQDSPWFILSAYYGLVEPETVYDPYNHTLADIKERERLKWGDGVLFQLQPHMVEIEEVVFLAGKMYRKYLEPVIHQQWKKIVYIPMLGMAIGKQLQWLDKHTTPQVDASVLFNAGPEDKEDQLTLW